MMRNGVFNWMPWVVVRSRDTTGATSLAWGLSKSLQLDAGLDFGLDHTAPGVQVCVGVSQKF